MNENIKEEAVSRSIVVDGSKVETFSKTFDSCNIITVEVGTTGHMGGDTGHGGRTYLRIADDASTDMRCRVISNGKQYDFDNACDASQIEIMFGGDTELDTFIEALEFAVGILKEQASGHNNKTKKELKQEAFRMYLCDLITHYFVTGKLSGMSGIRQKYNVTAITKEQFFECGLHEAAKKQQFYLDQDFCNKVYQYIRDRKNNIPAPKYQPK